MKRINIKRGQIWVTRRTARTSTPSRRILNANFCAVDRVLYSIGGDGYSRECHRDSFLAWIRRHQAKATRTRRPRTLVLR